MTAALGVILNHGDNTQKFFGGGEVENTSKITANDMTGHTNDIMCIKLNSDRTLAATGQVGSTPVVFKWCALTGECKGRFKLPKGSRGVNAIAWSKDGDYIACVDLHNDHNVYCIKTSDMTLAWKQKGGPDKVHDVEFATDSNRFVTVGTKHCYFWDAASGDGDKKKGIFNGNSMTSFCCAAWGENDTCYTGGANSKIYKWTGENRMCQGTFDVHKKGFVCTLKFADGKLYSGAKDGDIHEVDVAEGTSLRSWSFGNLVRAVDVMGGNMLAGLRNGDIWLRPLDGGEGSVIMSSHNDGEVWGLACHGGKVITSGDDNQVIVWDPEKRMKEASYSVTDTAGAHKRGGASTLSSLPPNQQSRCVASGTEHIAISGNDGTVYVRAVGDYSTNVATLTDAKEWNEVIAFSPDQSMLAVGSHDNNIYIYNTSDWSLKGTCKGHSSYIMALDFCTHNNYLRTNCGAYELLFWTMNDCAQDPSGRTNTTPVVWATSTVKFGWNVEGIYPKGCDGTHINGVAGSHDGTLLACGDDYGLVTLFNDPARRGCTPRAYRGHSEHVVRTMFSDDDSMLWSIGGYDQTVMQWTKQ